MNLRTLRNWGAPVLASVYFLALTGRSLYFYFTPDDSMNLYQAWIHNLNQMVRANLIFFRPSLYPRPIASAFFRTYLAIAGFHVAPLRAINLALLIANLFLAYAVAWRLAKSRTAAALSILLFAYHSKAKELYYNTGFLFDVLCFFFFFLVVIVYLRARENGRTPGWKSVTACCLLFICALGSKEIAATLPAILLIYELLYHGLEKWKSPARWFTILAIGAIDLLWIAGKLLAPHSLRDDPGYALVFTAQRFFETSSVFIGDLRLKPSHEISAIAILALWAAMLAVAWITKSRALIFAWLFLMVTALPLAFTDPRGVPQYYIPLFGWGFFAGALIEIIFSFALRRIAFANPIRTRFYASTALTLVLAVVLYKTWGSHDSDPPLTVSVEGEMNRTIVRQVHHLLPHLKPGAKLLFLDDPMNPDWWNMTFLMQLSYNDRQLVADRVRRMQRIPGAGEMAAYDHVLDYRGGYFSEIHAPWQRKFPPAVLIEDGRVQIFHGNWIPVTRENPARPDELVIVRAIDLGLSQDEITRDGMLRGGSIRAAGSVLVHIDRLTAQIEFEALWPDEPDHYRLDVRIPQSTPAGLAWIDLTVHGVTGPAVEFPVR